MMHGLHQRVRERLACAFRWAPLGTLLLARLCWAEAAPAAPQEPHHVVEAGLGPGAYQISDRIVRGLRWQGPSAELDASYRYLTPTDRHDGFLRMGGAYLENRYGHAAVSVSHHLGYGFTHRVFHAGRWGTLFLGGQVREDVDLQYYIDWDEEHAYWVSSYGIAAAARHEIRLAQHGFDVTLAFPVVGWVGRPPEFRHYKADNLVSGGWVLEKPFQGLTFASLDQYQAAHLGLAYTLHPGRGWSFRLAYLLDYRRATFPRPVQILVNTLTAGFVYAL